jgi:RNA polymerase sigma factor (sigma-70 family)
MVRSEDAVPGISVVGTGQEGIVEAMDVEGVQVPEGMASMPSSRLAGLYQEHVGRAVALATLLTGDRFVAEDVAHDAFLRVAGRFAELRDPRAFGPYLRTTVVNLCHARVRRLQRERSFFRRHADTQVVEPDTSADDRDQLWSMIRGLPYRQRAALVLRYWEDLSEAQIGEVMKCSPRAVNSLLSRAKDALRDGIGRSEG